MVEHIKLKNAEKNCPVRKNRQRKDSNDFIKEIPPLQTPGRSSKKRQNQPIFNSIPLSRGKEVPFSITTNTAESTPPVTEDMVPSEVGKADIIG